MSQLVRHHLLTLIAQDPSIGDDARRCEALLRDLCRNQHKKEIAALVTAVREGVVAELRNGNAGVPVGAQFDRLLRRLHEDSGLRADVSRWAIETWAAAYSGSVTTFRTALHTSSVESDSSQSGGRPVVQPWVSERFVVAQRGPSPRYAAHIGAHVRVHYADARHGLDAWQEKYYLAPIGAVGPDWSRAEAFPSPGPTLANSPADNSTFAYAPAAALSYSDHTRWSDALKDEVFRSDTLALLHCPSLKLTAAPGTTENKFRAQLVLALRERRNAAVEELRRKYAARLGAIEDRERRHLQNQQRKKARASVKPPSSALSVGGSLLGALFGNSRRGSAESEAPSAARSASRASPERADVAQVEVAVAAVRQQIESTDAELEADMARLESEFDAATIRIETIALKPRKADIAVEDLSLVWVP